MLSLSNGMYIASFEPGFLSDLLHREKASGFKRIDCVLLGKVSQQAASGKHLSNDVFASDGEENSDALKNCSVMRSFPVQLRDKVHPDCRNISRTHCPPFVVPKFGRNRS